MLTLFFVHNLTFSFFVIFKLLFIWLYWCKRKTKPYMVHIEVFWAYFHKTIMPMLVIIALILLQFVQQYDAKKVPLSSIFQTSRSHSDKKSITPSFMVPNLPLASGFHLFSALMAYLPYTSPKQGMMSNKVYVWQRLNIFKGLSKGLIPSDAIGVDFYIKKAEPHTKGGATCNV